MLSLFLKELNALVWEVSEYAVNACFVVDQIVKLVTVADVIWQGVNANGIGMHYHFAA